ncbi:MAG: hypothetical protein QM802_11560 [Agriterribacter sp.]
MNKIYITPCLIVLLFCSSCKEKMDSTYRPMLNSSGRHVGDSILTNGILTKIVFVDSLYIIDSIVFSRYNNNILASIKTFKNGKQVFSNSEYSLSGKLRRYIFKDEDNPNYYYERRYDSLGNFVTESGQLFFQGYIDNINDTNLEVPKGTILNAKIFFPNPPDCDIEIYVKNDENILRVFHQSKFIDFLQTASWDNDEIGDFKMDIWLDLKVKNSGGVTQFNKELIYKVR